MIYYILLFIVLIFLAYILGITIVTIIDKHLGNIAINLPKQHIVVNVPDEKFTNKEPTVEEYFTNNSDDEEPGYTVEGFNNEYSNYVLNNVIPEPEPKPTVCQENHSHNKCLHGKMNYADPSSMSPIDLRYYKYNYQLNLTLQDYINWLWLYNNSEDELPYVHMRNLKKIQRGESLKYKKGTLPPVTRNQVPRSTEEYFNKIYNSGDININGPLEIPKNSYDAYNYNRYPSSVTNFNKYK